MKNMSDSQQFFLRYEPQQEMEHFELRHEEHERPFHISFRQGAGRFIVNNMAAGTWGAGEWHEFAPGFGAGMPMLVHREGMRIAAFAGGRSVGWTIAPQQHRASWPLPAASSGIRWHALSPRNRAGVHWGPDGTPAIDTLPLPAGKHLHIPSALPPGILLEVFDAFLNDSPALLRNCAASGVPGALIAETAAAPALLLGSLMHRLPLFLCGEENKRFKAFAALANAAGIEAVHETPPDKHSSQGALIVRRATETDARRGACVLQHHAAGSQATRPQRQPAPRRASSAPKPGAHLPGLDIVVALYNTRAHVADCIRSLLEPSRSDIRVLVVDDGSTDGSDRLVADRFSDTPQVTLLRKPNGGCASARNFGRLHSDRSHIAFVDADDLVDPGFFGALHDLARRTDADMMQGGFDFLDPSGTPARKPYGFDQALVDTFPSEQICGETVVRLPPAHLLPAQPSIWRAVYRRAFLDEHAIWFPESIRAYDDFMFHVSCLCHANTVWMAPGRRYLYRQHGDQDVRARDSRHFGNLAMAMMLLRSVPPVPQATRGGLHATMLDVLGWSARRLAPEFQGAFLRAVADFCVTLEKLTANGALGSEAPADLALTSVDHPDLAPMLEQARAVVAGYPGGPAWRWIEPALAHPGSALPCVLQKGWA